MQATLIFPHQLFQEHPALHPGRSVVMVEEYLFFRQYLFHKQKILLHRASMRYYAEQLQAKGYEVIYLDAQQSAADARTLLPWLSGQGFSEFFLADTHDYLLERRLNRTARQTGVTLHVLDSPGFLLGKSEIISELPSKKRLFQTEFYITQRKKLGILMDHAGQPIGGKWTYDVENRKKYPKGKLPPPVLLPELTPFHTEALAYVLEHFEKNPGTVQIPELYPINSGQSLDWLQQFLEQRFTGFGTYEDAMLVHEQILHHSVLTPALNIGLLTPLQVLDAVLAHAGIARGEANAPNQNIHLPDLEGFIRQLIGWREFIRAVYITKGVTERTTNFWKFQRKIPPAFYDGTTGIAPVDTVIKRVLQTGYCHHIERLMVLGNFMLLCEFDPDEVYKWFMELFIDSYDWVMVPNVYGMSQFADGGIMATKPYLSASNYLMKMGDWQDGPWQATWDGLFWRFMHVHREFFLKNPRLSMLVRSFDKMPSAKREAHLSAAAAYLAHLDQASMTHAGGRS